MFIVESEAERSLSRPVESAWGSRVPTLLATIIPQIGLQLQYNEVKCKLLGSISAHIINSYCIGFFLALTHYNIFFLIALD